METPEIKKHKSLTLISTEKMSREQWLKYRMLGIGGSDLGTIMGVNKRMSPTELYYQKCGVGLSSDEINDAMFWGNALEDILLDRGQYLNLEDQTYKEAYFAGRKLREISKFRYMVQNDQYPWLIGNMDGLINYNEELMEADMVAEAKTISRQSAEMWETIPIYHLFQVQGYTTICEPILRKDAAIIFYLEDGRKLTGWEIPIIPDLQEHMLEESYAFWQKVLKGREVIATEIDRDRALQYMTEFEPKLVNTEAYYEFLSDLYKTKKNFIKIAGTTVDLDTAVEYKRLAAEIKAMQEDQQLQKNIIMKRLNDSKANIIELPNGGKITYNKKLYVNP